MPNAKATKVELADDGGLKIRLQAPAVEGKANQALVRYIAARLEVSRSSVQILTGELSRHKVIAVSGWTPEEIRKRLLA